MPGVALGGYDPLQHRQLGFTYAVYDRELGLQTFATGPGVPVRRRPDLLGGDWNWWMRDRRSAARFALYLLTRPCTYTSPSSSSIAMSASFSALRHSLDSRAANGPGALRRRRPSVR